MSTLGFVLLSAQKPPQGAACNGCGACCQNEACELSTTLLNSTAAPCIALEFDGEQYRCGLVVRPCHYFDVNRFADEYMRNNISQLLGIGRGCCSEMGTTGKARRKT